MIFALDIDKTLCSPISKNYAWDEVSKCKPYKKMIKAVQDLKKRGHKILILTNRSPVTRWETIDWLKKHKVPYDKIKFGKIKYDLLVDDRALPPYNFLTAQILEEYVTQSQKWDFEKGFNRTKK